MFTVLTCHHKAGSRMAGMAGGTRGMLFFCPHSSAELVNHQLSAPSKPPAKEGTLCSWHLECMNHFYCMPYMQNYYYLNLRWLISKIVQ